MHKKAKLFPPTPGYRAETRLIGAVMLAIGCMGLAPRFRTTVGTCPAERLLTTRSATPDASILKSIGRRGLHLIVRKVPREGKHVRRFHAKQRRRAHAHARVLELLICNLLHHAASRRASFQAISYLYLTFRPMLRTLQCFSAISFHMFTF